MTTLLERKRHRVAQAEAELAAAERLAKMREIHKSIGRALTARDMESAIALCSDLSDMMAEQ